MIYRYLLGVGLALVLAGCPFTQPSTDDIRPKGLDQTSDYVSSDGGQDAGLVSDGGQFAGVDPIVAHFFNTATLANQEAAVLAATQDGGANADAGN